jgi:hypothetical protein
MRRFPILLGVLAGSASISVGTLTWRDALRRPAGRLTSCPP